MSSLLWWLAEVREPSQGGQGGYEEVLAAPQHVEGLDPVDAAPHRLLRDGERRPVLLEADIGVALGAQAHEVAVVDPLLLQELQGGHRLGAEEDEIEAAGGFVILR